MNHDISSLAKHGQKCPLLKRATTNNDGVPISSLHPLPWPYILESVCSSLLPLPHLVLQLPYLVGWHPGPPADLCSPCPDSCFPVGVIWAPFS